MEDLSLAKRLTLHAFWLKTNEADGVRLDVTGQSLRGVHTHDAVLTEACLNNADLRDAESLRKCAHEPCQCLVSFTQEYCCAYCSDADDVENTELQCDCNHGKCMPKRAHYLFAACIEGQGSAVNSTAAGRAAVRQQDSLRSFAN